MELTATRHQKTALKQTHTQDLPDRKRRLLTTMYMYFKIFIFSYRRREIKNDEKVVPLALNSKRRGEEVPNGPVLLAWAIF